MQCVIADIAITKLIIISLLEPVSLSLRYETVIGGLLLLHCDSVCLCFGGLAPVLVLVALSDADSGQDCQVAHLLIMIVRCLSGCAAFMINGLWTATLLIVVLGDGDVEQRVLLVVHLLSVDSLMPGRCGLEGGSGGLGERVVEVVVASVMNHLVLVGLVGLRVECHVGCRELVVRGPGRAEVRDGLNGPCLCTPASHVTTPTDTTKFLLPDADDLILLIGNIEGLVQRRLLLEPLRILLDLIDLHLDLRL